MKKNIAILLPYKESYTLNEAAAASIWVKDYLKKSDLQDQTIVFGNLPKNKYPLTKNFINLNIEKVKFKKNYFYTKKFLDKCREHNFQIIEIHNRPESLIYLLRKKIKSKIIFVYHNNPQDLRYSKSAKERLFIVNNCHQIYFVSRWVMKKFFEGLPFSYKNNCEVLYPSISQFSNFPNKNKTIIFTGKLNFSKGYDLFGKAVVDILDHHSNWKAIAIGNEKREKYNFKHKNFKVYDWMPHPKIIEFYKRSSISVVCSRWQEPFGRTAMESAACGCATITSDKGGLSETFNNNLVLNELNSNNLYAMMNKIIKNNKLLKKIQKTNFNNVIHKIEDLVFQIDNLKKFFLNSKINYIKNRNLKILHISNFDEKNDHRLFNISIANKLSKGFVKNNHDIVNFSYRDFNNKILIRNEKLLNKKVFNIVDNYRPNLILLGHNNILDRETINQIKDKYNIKIALWYEDHLVQGGPNYKNNLDLIEKNYDLIDRYFFTTHPDVIKTKIPKNKIKYIPIPADENIENLEIYNSKNRYKDLFFALSHGVNYGKLKPTNIDEREKFLNELIKKNSKFSFNILGYANEQPKWNYEYFDELSKCKMALNLSRGKPTKYASSNRIASLIANGIMTFIDKKTRYSDFFDESEMGFYTNVDDLLKQIEKVSGDMKKINKISINGKKRYFSIFNNLIISDYILSKTFGIKNKFKYIWD